MAITSVLTTRDLLMPGLQRMRVKIRGIDQYGRAMEESFLLLKESAANGAPLAPIMSTKATVLLGIAAACIRNPVVSRRFLPLPRRSQKVKF